MCFKTSIPRHLTSGGTLNGHLTSEFYAYVSKVRQFYTVWYTKYFKEEREDLKVQQALILKLKHIPEHIDYMMLLCKNFLSCEMVCQTLVWNTQYWQTEHMLWFNASRQLNTTQPLTHSRWDGGENWKDKSVRTHGLR